MILKSIKDVVNVAFGGTFSWMDAFLMPMQTFREICWEFRVYLSVYNVINNSYVSTLKLFNTADMLELKSYPVDIPFQPNIKSPMNCLTSAG